MKKLNLIAGLFLMTMTAQAIVVSTNSVGSGTYILLGSRASVYSVEITSTANASVLLFDQNTLAAPYYGTNYYWASYTNRLSYPTNMVSSYVVNYGGAISTTNWYTNTGIFTYENVVAAGTNQLPVANSFVVAAGTYIAYNVDSIFVKGIAVKADTNISIVVNYRLGQ